jgi:hypothetical protein
MENQIEIIITQRVLIELLELKIAVNENTNLTKAEIRCLIDAQISKNEVELEKLKNRLGLCVPGVSKLRVYVSFSRHAFFKSQNKYQ